MFRSHGDLGLGAVDMHTSIVKSSNVYYYSLANEMGVDGIHAAMWPLGFGHPTGIDLEGEVKGVLPSTEWKRKSYRKPEQQKWYAGETISLGIGQGYNTFTMLQLASATATLVSGGQRFKPRLVREIEDVDTRERRHVASDALSALPYQREHVEVVQQSVEGGGKIAPLRAASGSALLDVHDRNILNVSRPLRNAADQPECGGRHDPACLPPAGAEISS